MAIPKAHDRSLLTTTILVASRVLAWIALATGSAVIIGTVFLSEVIVRHYGPPWEDTDGGSMVPVMIIAGSYVLLSLGVILRDK